MFSQSSTVICLQAITDGSNDSWVTTTVLWPLYSGQPVLASTSSYELGDFVGAEFNCQHAQADGDKCIDSDKCIQIRQNTLEFSSTVLSTQSYYLNTAMTHELSCNKTEVKVKTYEITTNTTTTPI